MGGFETGREGKEKREREGDNTNTSMKALVGLGSMPHDWSQLWVRSIQGNAVELA
jgi:hypothetical protein